MNEDLEFLIGLDKKLHKVEESTFTPNMSGSSFPIGIDTYTNKKMNKKEIKKVLEISKKMNFVIYPISTGMGFLVGYDVCEINPIGKKKVLLRFKEGQLPKKYDFEKMSKTFMSKANLTKAKSLGKTIVNDYSYYDY